MSKALLEEVEYDKTDLAFKIMEFEQKKKKTELLLNTSRGSIAATKANMTRGTYD